MSGDRKTFNEINITPLTDIFLVLLIIMMVIAPLLDQQGLNLTVPENVAQEQKSDKESKILTVSVTADNKYYIQDEEVLVTELDNVLKSQVKDYPDGLMIQTNGDATHGAVVKLMDSARNSGIKSISVSSM